jgi:hypothetical protein
MLMSALFLSSTVAQASSNQVTVRNQIAVHTGDIPLIIVEKLIPVTLVLGTDWFFVTSDSSSAIDQVFRATEVTSILIATSTNNANAADAAVKVAWLSVVAHWLYRQFEPVGTVAANNRRA